MTEPTSWRDSSGRMWNPYSVSFALFGGFYAFTIHAVSEEHAREQVRALRRTAQLDGQITSNPPTDPSTLLCCDKWPHEGGCAPWAASGLGSLASTGFTPLD